MTVVELPFQAHPDVPPEGVFLGKREGPMYVNLERTAQALGLPLNWPPRLPNSRIALTAAEWVRRQRYDAFTALQARLFRAHFVDGLDIGDLETVIACAAEILDEVAPLRQALEDGRPFTWIAESQDLGVRFGVAGTPAWRVAGQMIRGLLPEGKFEQAAARALASSDPA